MNAPLRIGVPAIAAALAVPAEASAPLTAKRRKPQVRVVKVKRQSGQDNSNGSYASLGLRIRLLPAEFPDWAERAAWKFRNTSGLNWSLKE